MTAADGSELAADFSLRTAASVLFDAVYVAGGDASAAVLKANADALHFVDEAFRHCKAIAATGAGRGGAGRVVSRLERASTDTSGDDNALSNKNGVVTGGDRQAAKVASAFVAAIAEHRHWVRETDDRVPGLRSTEWSAGVRDCRESGWAGGSGPGDG